MKKIIWFIVGISWTAVMFGARADDANSVGQITVAAAADLKFALDDMIVEFQQQHSNVTVKVSYGSSGNLFAQIENGAPCDLFLSADIEFPRRLIEAKK